MSPTLIAGDYIYAALLKKESVIGKNGIQRNDITVFRFPYPMGNEKMTLDSKVFYCKRCIAIPGDTFYINNQGIYCVKGIPDTLGNRIAQIATGKIQTYYDSLYIPRSGDSLQIDSRNFSLYRSCIEYETGKQMHLSEGKIYLEERLIQSYQFKKNYFFMAGDNVGDSNDSRYWGLLPDDFILGKGRFIWFSKDTETKKIRWERIFTRL